MMLDASDVTAVIDGHRIVSSAGIEVRAGEMVGLVGPNGSGKSTLLRCIYRVLRPHCGVIDLDGESVWALSARASAQRTAVVVQEPSTDFDFAVWDMVMMGRTPHLGLLARRSVTDDHIVERALGEVGVAGLADRSFRSLSGGEKQRVLLARALAQQSRLLVLDEPTNHLDIRHQLEVLELVRGLGIATVAALHDLNLAASYCDRLYVLSNGAIVAEGAPRDVLTAQLVGDVFGVGVARSVHPVTGKPQLSFFSLSRPDTDGGFPAMTPGPRLDPRLLTRLSELADLAHAGRLMAWDREAAMPGDGGVARGHALGTIERLAHDRLVAPELGALLDAAGDAPVARAVRRDHERAVRVPGELVEEMERAAGEGFAIWLQARERNDFAHFVPALRRNIAIARRYAACFPDAEHPYDPLLGRFEQGATAAQVAALLADLRDGLVGLLGEIAQRPDRPLLTGHFPVQAQREIGREIIAAMGFDPAAWRLDDAVHPFAIAPSSPGDVRITSRFDGHSLNGLFTLMHETGHGLYEHGVDPALARTTLDNGVSFGVHESQSRLWENLVGRSPAFWRRWLPCLRERFPRPLGDLDLDGFVRAINVVRPTLIRVEADEVTYSLHVILRFELEVALVEGTLDPADLPGVWAAKVQHFLGIPVPDDLRGALQDVHWAKGLIGYFPTYAIGNVLAAQLWRAVRVELPGLDGDIERGEYGDLLAWLRDKIHRHGRTLAPAELVEQAVGGPLDPAPFLEHLDAKYGALYELGARSGS